MAICSCAANIPAQSARRSILYQCLRPTLQIFAHVRHCLTPMPFMQDRLTKNVKDLLFLHAYDHSGKGSDPSEALKALQACECSHGCMLRGLRQDVCRVCSKHVTTGEGMRRCSETLPRAALCRHRARPQTASTAPTSPPFWRAWRQTPPRPRRQSSTASASMSLSCHWRSSWPPTFQVRRCMYEHPDASCRCLQYFSRFSFRPLACHLSDRKLFLKSGPECRLPIHEGGEDTEEVLGWAEGVKYDFKRPQLFGK